MPPVLIHLEHAEHLLDAHGDDLRGVVQHVEADLEEPEKTWQNTQWKEERKTKVSNRVRCQIKLLK